MENTLLSPLRDNGIFIDAIYFEVDSGVPTDSLSLNMRLGYDYEAWVNTSLPIATLGIGDDEADTDDPDGNGTSMLIDLYILCSWTDDESESHVGDEPIAYAKTHVVGQFAADIANFPAGVTNNEIARWMGVNAIDMMYGVAKHAIEGRICDSSMSSTGLPIINPYAVWDNSRVALETYKDVPDWFENPRR